jgi:excisionase family DNA binding protein
MQKLSSRYRTPPQIAETLGVNAKRVRDWIRDGLLVAVNVGDGKTRPRWRVSEAALDAFLAARSNSSPSTTPRRRKQPSSRRWV